jgi:PAS domain S-box-containing protein
MSGEHDPIDRPRPGEWPHAHHERHRVLFEAMREGYALHEIICDEDGNATDYRFLEVNPAFCELTGLPATIVGQTARQAIPGLEEFWIETYGTVALAGEAVSFDQYSEPLGRHYRVSAYPVAPRLFATVFSDITQLVEAHRAARDSEEVLRLAMDRSSVGIALVDGSACTMRVNPALCRILGYGEEELLGTSLLEHSHPDDLAESECLISKLRAGEIDSYTLEKRYLRKDHATILALISVSAVREADGTPRFAIVHVQDVTEQRRTEEQLRQAQKLESIGRLAAGVAHDFNNLLTVINGVSEMALGDLRPEDRLRESLEAIHEAGHRAEDVTRQLLAFSRKQLLEPRALDLNEVVTGVDSLLRRVIGEDVELSAVLSEQRPIVRADRGQLEQVLMNLAVNARDAMPTGGRLTIETATAEMAEGYDADGRPGPWAILAVTDTGAGMDRQTLEMIFEPFFTTKEKGRGTGLGLPAVFGTVKQSGGVIRVYSELGHGTSFKIWLPLAEASDRKKTITPTSGLPPVGRETILLVEDDEQVRKVAVRILEGAGYAVVAAASGAEALELFSVREGKIDLLITDVVMPRMSGRELVTTLQEHTPDLKVLFTSGYTENSIAHHGVLDPGVEFLGKPFGRDGLLRKVREVLDGGDRQGS